MQHVRAPIRNSHILDLMLSDIDNRNVQVENVVGISDRSTVRSSF